MGSSINLSDVGILLSDVDAEDHRIKVADLTERTYMKTFPGAQPVSFARHHLQKLQEEDYFMCEKTDGIRCLLFLTHFLNEYGQLLEWQLLVDRKNEYYFVPSGSLHMPDIADVEKFHRGTILDGELVRQKRGNGTRLVYLIFDILALDNECIMKRPFNKRLFALEQKVYRPYREFAKRRPDLVNAQPFEIQMKKMELPYGAEMMFRDILPRLPHGNDGLIFTCVGTPYVSGTDKHILKWKPPHENTIDFKIQLLPFPLIEDEDGKEYEDWDAMPEIELLINHGGRPQQYKTYAMLHLTDAEWEAMKNMHQEFDQRIMECYRDPANGHWRPKVEEDGTPRFRDDKTDSNHISVVEKVEESIRDAVSETDLVDAAAAIKRGYKARQQAKAEQEQQEQRVAAARAGDKRRREGDRVPDAQPVQQRRVEQANVDADMDDGPRYED